MAATWSAGSSWLEYTAGDFAGDDGYTIAALTKSNGSLHAVAGFRASSVNEGALFMYNWNLFGGPDDNSSGFSQSYGPTAPGWTVWAVTKAPGSAHYRLHAWTYASDGSGTMAHGEAPDAANHANWSPADEIRVGNAVDIGGLGHIAVTAMWNRALSDAELDTLVSNALSDWATLEPDFGVELSDWDGSAGDNVFAGSSTFSDLSGTIDPVADPTDFDYALDPPVDPPDEDPTTDGDDMLTTARGTVTTTLTSIQDYLGLESGYPGGYVVIENTGATTVYVTEGAIGSDKGFALATTKSISLNLHSLDDVFLVTASGSSAVQVACAQRP